MPSLFFDLLDRWIRPIGTILVIGLVAFVAWRQFTLRTSLQRAEDDRARLAEELQLRSSAAAETIRSYEAKLDFANRQASAIVADRDEAAARAAASSLVRKEIVNAPAAEKRPVGPLLQRHIERVRQQQSERADR